MFHINVQADELWDFMSIFHNFLKWNTQYLIISNCFTFYLSLCMYSTYTPRSSSKLAFL